MLFVGARARGDNSPITAIHTRFASVGTSARRACETRASAGQLDARVIAQHTVQLGRE